MAHEADPEIKVIAQLEEHAEKLRQLIDHRTAKRPLIIEFSGSPKAGKTMSIRVLDLFLRRNGIRVEAFLERASVAPIKTKGHMHFNTWVSCASLEGMLECLHKDIDIFILDRGIFDALVWNAWLEKAGKISHDEARIVEAFFSMERWTDLVDLVCVMTCSPQKSIEREFADQLTTRRGSIMDEEILNQLNSAVAETMIAHEKRFKRLVTIDTTNTSPREGVTQITTETLRTLQNFLDEPLCILPKEAMNIDLPPAGFLADPSLARAFIELIEKKKKFEVRSTAEADPNALIPIPCAIIKYENQLLLLRRKAEGDSLHDKYAIWAGGHVTESDDGEGRILDSALKREISEEIFIRDTYQLSPLGLVRTSETERASRHIGVLYEAKLSSPHVALALNQKEFRETRGKSMSGKLVDTSRLYEFLPEMGDWSKFVVGEYWPLQGQLFKPRQPKNGS